MKIAIIGPTYPFRGGISHYTTMLSRELDGEHSVLLVSFKKQYPDWLFPGKSNYDPSGVVVKPPHVEYLIDSTNPVTWVLAAKRIRRFRPDMVIFQWWVTFWAPHFWLISRFLRRVVSAPEIVFICHNAVGHEANLIKKAATKHALSGADRYITHCRETTVQLKNLLGRHVNVTTAFHPTYDDLCLVRPTRKDAREKLGVKGNVLLFFGFIREYKGLEILLQAMVHVLREKRVTLLVVGEFWHDKKHYLRGIDRLHLREHLQIVDSYVPNEEMGYYFAAADLVIQPYLRGSGSGVTQLAYAYERPVIATDVGSLSEVIKDGSNGRIVAPNDARALATAILESLEPHVLARFSRNCVSTKERFSWSKMAEIVLASGRQERSHVDKSQRRACEDL